MSIVPAKKDVSNSLIFFLIAFIDARTALEALLFSIILISIKKNSIKKTSEQNSPKRQFPIT
jgi:hypothetical protein